MLNPNQFLASKNLDESWWQEIRSFGISATEISNARTPAGYKKVLENRTQPQNPIPDNAYMAFGREQELPIALHLKQDFGIMPNDWTICHQTYRHHKATPDGISLDHSLISEIKTTGKDFNYQVPLGYMAQIQWQMWVTETERCVFAYMLREDSPNGFIPAWFEPKTMIVQRDDTAIAALIKIANKLWEEIQSK
jgi:hypothetical protein